MAKYSNVIEYKLKTIFDDAGLVKLQNNIIKTQKELQKMADFNLNPAAMEKSIQTLNSFKTALNQAFNVKLGIFDVSKLMTNMKALNISVKEVKASFEATGIAGQKAFNSMIAKIGSLDTGMKSISTTTQKVFNTFANTVRWGMTASVYENMSNSLYRAVEYVKALDRSLNDIRIVSGYNAEQMREFALEANNAAKALGKTTTAYTDASLIFIQQGKTLKESAALADLTLKTANVTGQATAEVSEQLTSLMNGYQIAVEDMEASVDKLAKVAAVGAADMEELATAEAKVASTANALGVSQDQLVAQLSTIISVTRQAPEYIFVYLRAA